jgi:hypothetical protein
MASRTNTRLLLWLCTKPKLFDKGRNQILNFESAFVDFLKAWVLLKADQGNEEDRDTDFSARDQGLA